MSEPAPRRWSEQEFFRWQVRQDERYELVGGVPVGMRLSARNVHDDIVVNLVAEFRTRLRGTPCRLRRRRLSAAASPGLGDLRADAPPAH